MFLSSPFLYSFLKLVLWTHMPFSTSLRPHFQNTFPWIFFLFSTLNSRMSRNMCKLDHKVRKVQSLPHASPNFKHFQSGFSNRNFGFDLRLLKTYSINPSLKNTLWLYVFKSLRQGKLYNLKNLN